MKAVIFDMDGVISDTQRLHAAVESELLARYGIEMSPEEMTAKYAGVTGWVYFRKEFDEHGVDADVASVVGEKWERMRTIEDGEITAMPGAVGLIGELKGRGLPLGVASASRREFVERVLRVLGLADSFDAVTTVEEVERGKPDPAVFLVTAEKLGVAPGDCVVIEDGVSGMEAARAAGMKCVGVVPEKDPLRYPAGLLVNSLEEVTFERMKDL